MKTNGFTHVSVHAHDLEYSARFYTDLFGMEEIPSPDFPFPVRWLKVGALNSTSSRARRRLPPDTTSGWTWRTSRRFTSERRR